MWHFIDDMFISSTRYLPSWGKPFAKARDRHGRKLRLPKSADVRDPTISERYFAGPAPMAGLEVFIANVKGVVHEVWIDRAVLCVAP